MKDIYFTRHGQTFWNVENKICGATDIDLTPQGYAQARELGEKIKAEQLPIDLILYSPLSRAKHTALEIAKITGIPAIEEPRLKEQNFGRFESMPRHSEDFDEAKSHFVYSFDGGETMLQLAQRIYNVLDDCKKRDETVLLVAHNGISRMVRSYFYNMSNEEFASYGIKNCEILKFTYKYFD